MRDPDEDQEQLELQAIRREAWIVFSAPPAKAVEWMTSNRESSRNSSALRQRRANPSGSATATPFGKPNPSSSHRPGLSHLLPCHRRRLTFLLSNPRHP